MKNITRAGVGVVAVAAVVTMAATTANAAVPTDTSALREAVTSDAIMDHLAELQEIADDNDGTRASGTEGYADSIDYIKELLTDAGYVVSEQKFLFNSFRELSEPVFDVVVPDLPAYVPGEDFFTAEYSGSGDVTAPLEAVDLVLPPGATASTSNSGCEPEDFADFTAGNIALVQRGTCDFSVKAANAYDAGAVGVIIFNEGQEGRQETLNATLGDQFSDEIPVVGTSFAIGDELAALLEEGEVVVHLKTDTLIELDVPTSNLIAETPTGRDDRVVMAGAHLDSVPDGPGIEDNGTGSAALLEIALQMADLGIEPRNTVRFAWWGAEEAGLVGSQYYVDQLSKREQKNIQLYLNFDMIGSPNYARFIYDGSGDAFGIKGPTGSGNIEGVFESYFDSQGLASEPTAFDGRSDYDAFISAGIPAGGLFTGAEDNKTPEQVALYGGLATFDGQPVSYDPCYHQPCDSMDPIDDGADADLYEAINDAYDGALEYDNVITNVNTLALEEMSDAAAHAILTFAMSTGSVSGTAKASPNATLHAGEHLGSHFRR
ncbi:Zn-dependent M28 family amino/carboxypeptidase [Agromyces flavus]|uniref:PA domain-containing protein n=1 Tax=Agromyces flavus TaxID=589382 RepID=A0A1H1Y9K9_9MICO|nr:M20/M25/M40 family metallo-hydrolase [Agromyces flavus]MCP2366621.1 Zn-dependent M28 family amino/carboxypeptidase [Agromyces flavus]GGI45042.1 aminopeptidase [Agromyces flavus]SDT18075.1 PA domain-containing protein [Agromyces flavus]